MAKKREKQRAASYLRRHKVPKDIVSAEQLARDGEESGRTFHETIQTVSDLLQAGSGLRSAPYTRRMLERGVIR